MEIFTVAILAMIGEALWETLKLTWQHGKFNIDRLGALLIGVLVAVTTNVDVMKIMGINTVFPHIGFIFTGILISRGANFMHDLLQSINNLSQTGKEIKKEL